ncbi:MAG: PorP/SprF family type IX secretion system membrane protein [Bacteroidia bacterium]|nr:PorP/SprF family type IX secretion system membrane protein [Bacteroidia bacterium]
MKHLYYIAALLLFGAASAQDIHFSQFTLTPLQLNPASAGGLTGIQASVNYKSQWGSVGYPYRTYSASLDVAIGHKKEKKKGFFGLGIFFYNDKAGDASMSTLQGNLNAAYHLRLSERSMLSAGAYYGFAQRSASFGALKWESQYVNGSYAASNPSGEPGGNAFMQQDLGAGIFWTLRKGDMYMTSNDHVHIDAGVAYFHILPMVNAFGGSGDVLYSKYVGHFWMSKGIKNSRLALQPSVLFFMQGPQTELNFGLDVKYQVKENSKVTGYEKGTSVYLGLHHRLMDAVVINAMYEYDSFTVGLSYDVNVSELTNATFGRGGLEVALRYRDPFSYLWKNSSRH